ncbi:MAG: hypothetical protein Q8P61_08175 [Candidatus Nanopelagicales bacterium]|nr:hypothetical protein [Candidatus Nanopelagicales bacterium]
MTENQDQRPRIAVWKFTSCDGCQLSLLGCEDELLAVSEAVRFAYFLEATSSTSPGPYDVSLVEGSISTPGELERIQRIRDESKVLVALGACATGGGIQALRNFADVREFTSIVYARPEYITTLDTCTPISDHVEVDLELRGCPVDKGQLIQVLSDLLAGRDVALDSGPVCLECKRRGNSCVMVNRALPCLGPVTHGGCGALCPSFDRGCFGCFGPADTTNTAALTDRLATLGMDEIAIERIFHTFAADTPAFRDVGRGTGAESLAGTAQNRKETP